MTKINKKHAVLLDLYRHCEVQNDFVFHNDLVKEISKKHGFGKTSEAQFL